MDISMTEEEAKLFIAGRKLCRIATVSPRGTPHVVPIWFVVLDGEIYISTQASTRKGRNMEASDRVGLVFDRGWSFDDFRGVSFQGRVERVVSPELEERVREAMAQKYFGSNRHPGYLFLSRMPDSVVYRFVPESTYSWDSDKLDV